MLTIRIVPLDTGSNVLLLCDETGNPLPGQTQVTFSGSENRNPPGRLIVEFEVGPDVQLVPDPPVYPTES